MQLFKKHQLASVASRSNLKMAATKSFFSILLASNFYLAKTDVNWTVKMCTTNNSVESIKGKLYPPGFLPLETTWSSDSKSLGNFRTCLSLCCRDNEARNEGNCAPDNVTNLHFLPLIRIFAYNGDEQVLSTQNFYPLIHDPCDFDWMEASFLQNFSVLKNGTIMSGAADLDGGILWDLEYYCLYRDPGSLVYSAKVCHPWITGGSVEICCCIFVILILLTIFIVYTFTPELRNLHGMIFRSYLATYMAAAVCVVAVELTVGSRDYANLYSFSESAARCCCASCVAWLNVMSFNIWRSFRELRSINYSLRKTDKQKFIWYAIYAWVCPGIMVTTLILGVKYVPYFRHETIGYTLKIWLAVAGIAMIYICNTFMFFSTALSIRQHKNDTADLANGVNRHHEMDVQWFNLYMKLFVIMGGHILVWPIWLVWPTRLVTYGVAALELIQAILVFVIFVWKDKMKWLLREELSATLRKRFNSFVQSLQRFYFSSFFLVVYQYLITVANRSISNRLIEDVPP